MCEMKLSSSTTVPIQCRTEHLLWSEIILRTESYIVSQRATISVPVNIRLYYEH
jgi:hypothetical protein